MDSMYMLIKQKKSLEKMFDHPASELSSLWYRSSTTGIGLITPQRFRDKGDHRCGRPGERGF